MKRCPQCNFVYLETDEVCDLDGALLVHADDIELDAAPEKDREPRVAEAAITLRKSRKSLAVAVVAGVLLGVLLFIAYRLVSRRVHQASQLPLPSEQRSLPADQPPPPSLSPTPISSPSPEASPTANPRSPSSPTPGSKQALISRSPVSTSTKESSGSGPAVIRLHSGARIEADEVWRNKEGIWYRRGGMVTLIKANQVKSIDKAAPKR